MPPKLKLGVGPDCGGCDDAPKLNALPVGVPALKLKPLEAGCCCVFWLANGFAAGVFDLFTPKLKLGVDCAGACVDAPNGFEFDGCAPKLAFTLPKSPPCGGCDC